MVDKPEFWKRRIYEAVIASPEIHRIIYVTDINIWQHIQNETQGILQRVVTREGLKVLDAGCGIGSIYGLFPVGFPVTYIGVDISPDLIELARMIYPQGDFRVGDLCNASQFQTNEFDLTVIRSLEQMLKNNQLDPVWNQMLSELRRISKMLVFIEFECEGPGVVTYYCEDCHDYPTST